MRDRLIVLFGGGGFVGRYVARALLARGARVRIAQRDPRQALYLKTQGGLGQTQFVAADLTRPDSVRRALAGADGAVNLVGVLDGDFQRVHVEGARNVAEAAAAAGLRDLVQMSAIGADPRSPSAYGRSKGEGEAAVRAAFRHAVVLRPSVVFGREDRFVNRFARMIATAPVVPVVAPATRFQPIWAGDVAEAVATAIESPERFAGRTFELGGPDVIAMRDLFRWIAATIGRRARMVELPDEVAGLLASLPIVPPTRDQWAMLRRDNVVGSGAEGIAAFGIDPVPLATLGPDWLVTFRRNGRFGRAAPVAG